MYRMYRFIIPIFPVFVKRPEEAETAKKRKFRRNGGIFLKSVEKSAVFCYNALKTAFQLFQRCPNIMNGRIE